MPSQLQIPVLITLATVLAWLVWRILSRKSEALAARELEKLRCDWGKPIERTRDFNMHPEFLKAFNDSHQHERLDDQTWRDLNLESVFASLDRTYSLPGEIELYRILRTPTQNRETLFARDADIEAFQSDANARESIQVQLSKLDRTLFDRGILELLWGDLPPPNRLAPIFGVSAILAFVLVAVCIVMGIIGSPLMMFSLVSLGAVYAVNFLIHYWSRRTLDKQVRSIRYLSKMIVTGRKISELDTGGFEESKRKLKRYATATSPIPSATVALVPERGAAFELIDLLQEHVSILFLIEVRAFQTVLKESRQHQDDLREMFHAIGELDAFQAIASFRDGVDVYCKPEFTDEGLHLDVEGIYHPLVDSPVPNSISISQSGCVVTGTNMSGKSTFLRALGLSAVLAQSIYTCCAARYRGSLFRVVSSINPVDDLIGGKSFYFVEAERLLSMIRKGQEPVPVLCIIDELLRGTNSHERLAASEAILSHLKGSNSVVIVATHDAELADRLQPSYDQCHFGDDADMDGLHFDYQLRSGRAKTTNAIRLLQHLGYPHEIVERAQQNARDNQARRPRAE